jgi:glycosyltransferase involved in cell wall biosynthesis
LPEYPAEITILSPGFPNGEADTVCMPFLHALARAHAKHPEKANIRVLTFHYPFHQNPYPFYRWKVVPFAGKNRKGIFKVVLWMRILYHLLTTQKPQVVVCLWANEASLTGNLFRGLSGVHCITWMIGQDVLSENRYLRFLRIDPRRYFAMSPMMEKTLQQTLGVNTRFPILPMGVDEDMHAAYSRAHLPKFHILGAGSLSMLKQWHLFLEVCSEVKKQVGPVSSILLGEGPEKETLLQLSETLGLGKEVLAGEVSNREVISLMYASCILLHTSSTEGQSTVISDALRAGMHVVCFDVGRMEIPGRVHVCKSTDEMAAVVVRLLSDPHVDYLPRPLPTAEETWNQLLDICTS